MTDLLCDDDTLMGEMPQLGRLDCDAYHHHYHYQASAQYLWLAVACRALRLEEEAQVAYKKAIFQDHQNEEAIAQSENLPRYDKHPLLDAEFCANVGQMPSAMTALHDEGIASQSIECFSQAITCDAKHSNSWFARGKLYMRNGDAEKARADFLEAIRLSHLAHDNYHHEASAAHVARGQSFLSAGEVELAINDFSKALDLDRSNHEAIAAREEAYRLRT